MLTEGLRIYGKSDLRVEKFELPPIKDDEILAKVVSDSLCMSSYKAAIKGEDHKRIPKDIATNPILLGHEFCGEIVEVGKEWQDKYKPGDRFVIQPALNYKGSLDAPGYAFPYCGGCATYVIMPHQVMELGCLIPYNGKAFFYGSLAEPISCIIGSFKEFFHTHAGVHQHIMGNKEGGSVAILAGAGPMGLGAVDYAVHGPIKPKRVVVTDINEERLKYAATVLSPENARENGVELIYVCTAGIEDQKAFMLSLNDGVGYDDVLAMAPVRGVAELADAILGFDGCLSFFAGPTDTNLKGEINFYDVHYNQTHIIGTVGGNAEDMEDAVRMIEAGLVNPVTMITHVGGLNIAGEATLNLPKIPGGKKLVYTHAKMDLVALADLRKKGEEDARYLPLADIVEANNGLWCPEAEEYVLKTFVEE